MLASVAWSSLKSLTLAPAISSPSGTPAPSVSRLRFVPCLALSVGLRPLPSPPRGGFRHRSVGGQPLPLEAFQAVVFHEPLPPQFEEETRLAPLAEAPVGGRAATDPGPVERVPLTARPQHEGAQAPGRLPRSPLGG
jgi:hypothetical protein